jgi:uncharacterized protein
MRLLQLAPLLNFIVRPAKTCSEEGCEVSSASTRLLGLVAFGCAAGCGPSANNPPEPRPGAPIVSPSAVTPDATPSEPTSEPSRSDHADASPGPVAPGAGDAPGSPTKQPKAKPLDELLLFFPSKYPDGNWQPDGLSFEDARFSAADGTRLHGWYCPCENARAVVLYAYGNAGNLSHRSPRMKYLQKELRVAALVFDYRGYGRSEGTPTVEGILQDARAARKCLGGLAGVSESRIVLLGDSLGGAVATDLAGTDGARGLILENTFSSLKDVATYHYPKLAWLVPADKLNSVSRIGRYKGPLLQCHGDADRTIPYALGLKLFEAAPGAKQFVRIARGDHNDPQSADYLRQLDRFIGELPER